MQVDARRQRGSLLARTRRSAWAGLVRVVHAEEVGTSMPEELQQIVQKLTAPDEDGVIWVHGFNYRTYNHPDHGKIEFTREVAEQMANNFSTGVLERDVTWNYAHGNDVSKGQKAAGTVADIDVRDDGLWVGIKPTAQALKEIQDGEWRYVSIERLPEWTHNSTGETHKNVLWGGAFTNTPFVKGLAPINLSDFDLYDRVLNRPPAPEPEPDPEKGGDNEVDREKLCEQLGLPTDTSDEDINKKIQALSEAAERGKAPEPRVQKLAETDPELYEEVMRLKNKDRQREAQEFAEGVRSADGKVLAVVHREAVATARYKLERGEITVQEFAEVMSEATSKGFVHMGEVGTGTNGEPDEDLSDKLTLSQKFAEGAANLAKEKDIDYMEAIQQYADAHPDQAQAYAELPVQTADGNGGGE